MTYQKLRLICFVLVILFCQANLSAHEGPDPVARWKFEPYQIQGNRLKAHLGPDLTISGKFRAVKDELGHSVFLNGRGGECLVAQDGQKLDASMRPRKAITVAAWVAVDRAEEYGGIVGMIQDNGDEETGWVLGYRHQKFCFALASEGADDGNGMMTYLVADQTFELGKFYFVVGVYDGKSMEIYINGKLAGKSDQQHGDVLYPKAAPFTIGAYRDQNEFFPMRGRLREITLYDIAAKQAWVTKEFDHQTKVAALESRVVDTAKEFVVKPYLQYGTTSSMTVAWRSPIACDGKVHWGEDEQCRNELATTQKAEINHVKLDGLQPETQYFYYVETQNKDGQIIESDVSTFQTACQPETPFAFAILGDTQGNPKVNGEVAKLAWQQRPHFLLHAGDLVDQGKMTDDWIDEFFASMHPLISRVPFYPVLGNHEQNARNYFDYMVLPNPEYYYQFRYGNTDFFMIDSNRNVGPDSEQYQWLDQALAKSKATWKIVCHHHPPFSSDENDYGNLWKTNKSSRGDLRVRQLVNLYDKHQVDIVWNGHIHSYERTWPLRNQKAAWMGAERST